MKSLYKKDDYNYMARRRRMAFMDIAKKLGKEHPVTKMMGTLAWGRSDAEQGPEGNLHTAIREVAFLDGFYSCLNRWMRDNDRDAQYIANKIYPFRYESYK